MPWLETDPRRCNFISNSIRFIALFGFAFLYFSPIRVGRSYVQKDGAARIFLRFKMSQDLLAAFGFAGDGTASTGTKPTGNSDILSTEFPSSATAPLSQPNDHFLI